MIRFRPARSLILNSIGILILFAGLGSTALIERNARLAEEARPQENEANYFLLHPESSRAYMRSANEMEGPFGVFLADRLKNISDLGHSRTFAIVLAVGSLAAAAGVFIKALLLPGK